MTEGIAVNYQAVYDRFILDRQSKGEPAGYSEKHHIVPRSMGGSNRASNLVRLTPSDHLFAHKLLAKIHNTRGMWFAFLTMCSKGGQSARGIVASRREYERARLAYAESLKTDHPMKGKKLSDESRKRISQNSPKLSGSDHPMFGKKHSQKSKDAMSKSSRRISGKDHHMFGKTHKEDLKIKWSIMRLGLGNPCADKKTYNLKNNDGSEFVGLRYEFCKKFGFSSSDGSISRLLNNKIKSYKGWRKMND